MPDRLCRRLLPVSHHVPIICNFLNHCCQDPYFNSVSEWGDGREAFRAIRTFTYPSLLFSPLLHLQGPRLRHGGHRRRGAVLRHPRGLQPHWLRRGGMPAAPMPLHHSRGLRACAHLPPIGCDGAVRADARPRGLGPHEGTRKWRGGKPRRGFGHGIEERGGEGEEGVFCVGRGSAGRALSGFRGGQWPGTQCVVMTTTRGVGGAGKKTLMRMPIHVCENVFWSFLFLCGTFFFLG